MAGPCETGLCEVGPDDQWFLLLLAALTAVALGLGALVVLTAHRERNPPGRRSYQHAATQNPEAVTVHEIRAREAKHVRYRQPRRRPRTITVVARQAPAPRPDPDTVPLDRPGGDDE